MATQMLDTFQCRLRYTTLFDTVQPHCISIKDGAILDLALCSC